MIDTFFSKRDLSVAIASALIISLATWSLGLTALTRVQAAGLTSVSDTLSTSAPGVGANHTIAYTNPTSTTSGQTIQITFDPTTSLFTGIGSVVFADVSFSGATLVASCTAAASEVTLATSTTALTFTVCSGDTVASGTKSIAVSNTKIVNPTSTGSYIIRIAGTQTNSADTRVAIVNTVTVSAAVDTTFTFTIAGVATSTSINGATTTIGTSATAINFGTLSPGSAQTAGQQLTVTTNARNGFVVTVKEDQNLTSNSGADIDLFRDGNASATPSTWVSPANTLDAENTYGHFGLTSDDADLNSGEFVSAKFAGNFQSTSSRQIFSHTGPADGSTQNKGLAKVAYRVEIASLQEAGNDYTNVLTYVATPTF